MSRLQNLENCRRMLRDVDRSLLPFYFTYNHVNCHVLIQILEKPYNTYWTMRLTFINIQNMNSNFECHANSNSLDVPTYVICDFFNIEREDNQHSRDIMNTFYNSLNAAIPDNIDYIFDQQQQDIVNRHIYEHDDIDERDKIYLFDFRRTGNRSYYNNDKAASRYPQIYQYFKDYSEYSFFFSDDQNKEVTLEDLLFKLERRQ